MSVPNNGSIPSATRHDHSFVHRTVIIYSKPAAMLMRRHFRRLDASFLRLSNDFLWLNDDQHILEMVEKRSSILHSFESEIDQVKQTYSESLKKHLIPPLDLKKLKPVESFSFDLHASTSLDAIRIFEKLDRIFLLLESMKQNGLVDELAFVHTCNAWKNSAGIFAKAIHNLRTQCLEDSIARKDQKEDSSR